MNEDSFRTIIEPDPWDRKIRYADQLLMIGSCFTEQIGGRLEQHKFRITSNPFGILFNPQSILQNLQRVASGALYASSELQQVDEKWVSWDHHGRFSNTSQEEALERINAELTNAHKAWPNLQYLFITLGSAWAYQLKSSGHTVANCHRHPNKEFDKRLLNLDALVAAYTEFLQTALQGNPELQIIFTVSPVRHWKDGPIQNQRSKSLLHLLVHELCDRFESVNYFPAYELVMDDLRDYRFYDRDLLHPNQQAVDYIWDKFQHALIDSECEPVMKEVARIRFALDHRTDDPESRSYQRFVRKHLDIIESLKERHPLLDLSAEEGVFRKLSL